jgi:hypothetical protein
LSPKGGIGKRRATKLPCFLVTSSEGASGEKQEYLFFDYESRRGGIEKRKAMSIALLFEDEPKKGELREGGGFHLLLEDDASQRRSQKK